MNDVLMNVPDEVGKEEKKTRMVKKAVIPKEIKENDIYVTRKRPLIVYFRRAMNLLTVSEAHNSIYEERLGCRRNKKLFKSGKNEQFVVIHGMGACIMTAIWLVQDLKSNLGDKINIEVTTNTIKVTDVHINEEREWESSKSTRNVSGISIKVTMNKQESRP
ncbi:unnamed protein product [Cryptosporidium hominis]|uniref:Ribonucleases P/MRP protein subunit Rpp200-like protein n=1 Tax=Cryptosporidium hominis TaxID=237895 RepID=A0A0S4TJD0_CRYHO|nr:hypothetical protein ChTU502y2012_407g2295 [Cryptosporidium hominis]PPA65890.1 Rpp20 subunit of nuclear RNase MRP and P family protein [Cryptosporidium hominis]PPS95666.1 Ribonucleases P/MRP protein subunit Rpp200-like protein [Cryptosporidium hominis]CUV07453.1 unnamed protein product [Cryptosporidium hominis]|eukprot:PPS95666.1 Ribonucleases P/MRP protein subunit Rpp200-like protein [Cryptosporidium hominis]